jgi:steroid delta-isomerase-like uncharacterized protein/uncharacterized protein (TIGR02246 family)
MVSGQPGATGEPRSDHGSGSARGTGRSPTAKEIVRSFYDLWNKGSMEGLDRIVSADVIDHNPLLGQTGDYAGVQKTFEQLLGAFSNIEVKIDKMISQGDTVATHWTATATHSGDFMGIPATGKQVSYSGTDMARINNSRIVEVWHDEDFLTVLQQIGGLQHPGMPQASESSAPDPDPAARPQAEAAINDLLNQFVMGWNNGDTQAMAGVFTADAVMTDRSGAQAQGSDAIQSMLNDMMRGWAKDTTAAVKDVKITFAGPLKASVDASLIFTPKAGAMGSSEPIAMHLTGTAILRPGGWRMSEIHISAMEAVPAPTPMPAPVPTPLPAPGVTPIPTPYEE